MKGDKIDFSPLDPSRDKARWDGLVSSVARRAVQARRRRLTIAEQMIAWSRPMIAAAAGLAMVSWIGAMATADKHKATAVSSDEPALTLAAWAAADEVPDTRRILEVVGATDGTR